MSQTTYLWRERKKIFLGLPWTFTVYELREDKLCVSRGFFSKTYDEIRLYRIKDFTVKRNLWQRLIGLGTIHVCSADSTSPEFDIQNIWNALKVKDMISNQVEIARGNAGVSAKELMGTAFSTECDEN